MSANSLLTGTKDFLSFKTHRTCKNHRYGKRQRVRVDTCLSISASGAYIHKIFGDGRDDFKDKRYYVDVGTLNNTTCNDLEGTIRVYDPDDLTTPVEPPSHTEQDDYYHPTEYELKFEENNDGCLVYLSDDNVLKEKFIVSNLDHKALLQRAQEDNTIDLDNTAVLYGGIGNHIEVEINTAKKEVPIEPIGIIVLAIDGLRQDVLYGADEASYADPSGCGQDVSCNIEVNETNLPGLSRIMGADSTIKLKNVTSVFPSITLASWASVFTGKMPGETGILGNEFFARDLSVSTPDLPGISVPRELNNPPGIISLSSGAFEGYDEFGLLNGLFTSKFFVPYQPDWKVPPIDNIEKTPQNDRRVLLQDTVYESIAGISGHSDTGMEGVKQYFAARGGDPVVVANNHYARGAYWLTWDIEIGSGVSQILDKASWDKLDDYLQGKYMESGERNGVPFSALTVWYLPGLDHEAHGKGMGVYRDYFINTTDNYINKVMETLKNMGEFDNKIFIVVADHGHTAMPTGMTHTDKKTGTVYEADTSCKLTLKGFDDPEIQEPEHANNNLHIWELGEVFRSIGEQGWAEYKVLAPKEIAQLFQDKNGTEQQYGATDDINRANVISALNGPVAHVYLKGLNGWGDKQVKTVELSELAGFIKTYTMENGLYLGKNDKNKFSRLLSSVDTIFIRDGGEYKIFNGVLTDEAGNITGPDVIAINETTFNSDNYVKALKRITGLNNPDRSGDIVLIFKDITNDNPDNRYTSGVACKSWHGSLNPSDSYVPLIVSYPGGNMKEIEPLVDSTINCSVDDGCEGNWNVTDIIKTIVSEQYKDK